MNNCKENNMRTMSYRIMRDLQHYGERFAKALNLKTKHSFYFLLTTLSLSCILFLASFERKGYSTFHGTHVTHKENFRLSDGNKKCAWLKPTKIDLSSEYLWMNHPGKAGGGTLQYRLAKWKVKIDECHPRPCITKFPDKNGFFENEKSARWSMTHRNKITHMPGSYIVVRDPVDRFVSAFNWRGFLLCHPYREDERLKKTASFLRPRKWCEDNLDSSQEKKIVFDKYKENVNKLAESLCDVEKNPEILNDMKQIRHLTDRMVDFLPLDWSENPNVYENLIPIILEPGFDFQQMSDEAISYGLKKFNILSENEVRDRKKYVDCLDNSPDLNNIHKHSTARSDMVFRNFKLVSAKGIKCAVNYFKRDYDFLEQLLYKGCKSGECVSAIESILERRGLLRREVSENEDNPFSAGNYHTTIYLDDLV